LQLSDTPGAVLAVTARSVRRPEVTSTVEVTVEPFFILQGVDDGEAVTVTFTNGDTRTGVTLNEGVVFDEEDLPGGEWVIEQVEIGATTVLVGRPSGSVVDTPVSLAFTGGPGSYTLVHRPADSEGFVPIGSYDEFQLIYDLTNLPNLAGHYKQEADLDLLGDKDGDGTFGETDDEEWTAIGANASRFTGTFDGDNRGITNLYIDENTNHYQGLFGYAEVGSTISSVRILSGMVKGTTYTGGVVGRSAGTITGCSNSGTVTGTNTNTGGVVGRSTGTVTGCANSGDVRGTSNYTGGVVGMLQGAATITGCSNSGDVTGNGQYVGGVTGTVPEEGTITTCSNSGDVTGTSTYTGGVVGQCSGPITNCSNSGDVRGTSQTGGVAGWFKDGKFITASFNAGSVSGTSQVGGLAGDLYNTASVNSSYNTGMVTGTGSDIGGVAGLNTGIVSASYNTGTVSGTTNIGGVVGFNNSATAVVTACYYIDNGVSGYGTNGGGGSIVSLTSFNANAFPNLSGDPAWGTGSGSGASQSPPDSTPNDWWKDGTTGGGQLPKLWFEK
jgi:hypothetical protein